MDNKSIGKDSRALLVVSFGTSYPDTCERTIGAIERELAAAFPERTLYRAWTSGHIRRRVEKDQGIVIDDVAAALDRMLIGGVTDVLVQPTHMLDAQENRAMTETLQEYEGRFERMRIGKPLLSDAGDISEIAAVLPRLFPEAGREDLVLLMGHGSPESDNTIYLKINEELVTSGHSNIRIALLNAHPILEDILPEIEEMAPGKILLAPFMVVAGAHARRDLDGDKPTSWKQILKGYQTEIVLKGAGEYPEIRKIYVRHAKEADEMAGSDEER